MTKKEHNESYYQTCKRLHKCVRCGEQDARTLIGKPLCFGCCEKKREESKGRDQTESHKKAYNKAVENGMCVRCCKRKAEPGKKTCKWCNEKRKKAYREKQVQNGKYSRSEAKEYGICSICLKEARLPGQNTCKSCYEMVVNRFKGTQTTNKLKDKIGREVARKEWYLDQKREN